MGFGFKIVSSRTNRTSDERGVALMELAVALPFLLILIIGVIDIGRMINQYLLLNYAVKTGVLKAMSQPSLLPGNFLSVTGNPGTLCPSSMGGPVTANTRHQNVQNEVQRLIGLTDEALKNDYCIRTGLAQTNVPSDPRFRTVDVELRAKYEAFFPLLDGMPITLSATGPYLVSGR